MQTLKTHRTNLECILAGVAFTIAGAHLIRTFPRMLEITRSYQEWSHGITHQRATEFHHLRKGPFPSLEMTLKNVLTTPSIELFKLQAKQIDDFGTESNLLLPHAAPCANFNAELYDPATKKSSKLHFDCRKVSPFVSSAILCYNQQLATKIPNSKKVGGRKLEMMAQATILGYNAEKDIWTVEPYCFTSTGEETEMVFRIVTRYLFIKILMGGFVIGISIALARNNWDMIVEQVGKLKDKVGEKICDQADVKDENKRQSQQTS